ncbi:hypothetical protein J3Q64DRAFT_1728215 [Phycomyces blakesleeanus]|uniref:Thioredoxin domain-containing protein n=2 Tax=Phycomyces blakesleeanus TaxID=4837 RepID=A0A162NJ46_PHYB8|nr:hypothetical protein PHYBLDRAFT_182496 [Phycomyces blakesleeanus NRRL 1555(-)]OAD70144.1 hypothetical protein PHYBLDRAFT_182496 [Phycomyces blakesleeanus NRRL 1555(-)]|eukprot:XP_018288184.1 hypothetical protein PHYBLDRAFT_182496 [Phycomyces blakesleeanus NRRL 1555(-)]
MKISFIALTLFALAQQTFASKGDASENGISKVITPEALKTIKANSEEKPWFVKYYAPWCGHCQKLEPIWDKVAVGLKDSNIGVGEVNCEDNKELCSENGVSGLPSLKFYAHDTVYDYVGDRTHEKIEEYAKKMAGPPVESVNEAGLIKRLGESPVSVVTFCGEEDHAIKELTNEMATPLMGKVPFYVTSDVYAFQRFNLGLEDVPVMLIVKDDTEVLYTPLAEINLFDKSSRLELLSWINKERFPLVNMLNRANSVDLLKGDHLVVMALMENSNEESVQAFRDLATKWKNTATENDKNTLFVQLDSSVWANYANRIYKLTASKVPKAIILDPSRKQYFSVDLDKNTLSIDKPNELFKTIRAVSAGKLEGTSTTPPRGVSVVDKMFSFVGTHWIATSLGLFSVFGLFMKYVFGGSTPVVVDEAKKQD